MNWVKQLFWRHNLCDDLSAEIQSHIEEKTDELVESGMSREEASFAARRAFGNATLIEEHSREVWGWPIIETFIADVRFGFRMFRKNPSVTLVAVLSLALGIGATTVVFSMMYAVLIDPYPYKGADRMAHVHIFDQTAFAGDLLLSSAQFEQLKADKLLDGAIAVDQESVAMTGGDLPESVSAGYLSSNAFDIFGVPPLLGREFSEADAKDALHPANVVNLSYRYWKSHYAGSSDVVGKSLELEHEKYTIIGVLPERFAWWPGGDVWFPLKHSPDPNRTVMVFVRIKPDVTYPAAQAELEVLIKEFAKQAPGRFPRNFKIQLMPLNEIFVGAFAGTLWVISGAVGILLVIGCANVSILLLSRGVARKHELAVRAAIGAGQRRILRQLLTEAMTLSIAGGSLGIAVAYCGVAMVVRFVPVHTFPGEASFRVNLPVLLFAVAVAMLTGIIFGLWPAFHFSGPQLSVVLQSSNRKLAGNIGSVRTHKVLIASQVAMTLVLLAGAGATVRTMYRLIHSPLGYDPNNVGCITIPLRDGTYPQWGQRLAYYEAIRQKAMAIPGVLSAAIEQSDLPPESTYKTSAEIRGTSNGNGQIVTLQEVSEDYFSTLRIPQLLGRVWSPSETRNGVRVAVINEAMAHHYWPQRDAIGQMVHLEGLRSRNKWMLAAPANDGWVQIVGVVGDTPNNGLHDPISPAVYVPYTLVLYDAVDLIMRTRSNPLNYVRAVRQEIHSLEADQVIGRVTTAQEELDSGLAGERFISTIFLSFAFVGLALGAVGLYSVVSYIVSQRTHEFAIRMALGATRAHVIRTVMKSSAVTVIVGVGAGLAVSLGLSKLLAHWTEGNVRDPLMLGAIILIFLCVVFIASLIPARRAAAIHPMQALRTE